MSAVERSRTEGARAELAARLRQARLRSAGPAAVGETITRRGGGPARLSPTQERFWLRQKLFPGDVAGNVFMALRLRGPLDVAALRLACQELTRRHEVLRARFVEVDGVLTQQVADADGLVEKESAEGELARIAAEEAGRPFDLETGPPFRAVLVRVGDDHHALMITIHHIATDAWSNTVLLEELAACYAAARDGQRAYPPAPRLQFADYAEWQRRRLAPEDSARLADHWSEVLAGAPGTLDLPTDRPRPPGGTSRSGRVITTVDPEVSDRFGLFCGSIRVPLFAGLAAALQVLLHRYSGARDFVVGVPFGGRRRPELARVVGPLFTTLPLRADLSGTPSFRELALRVRSSAADAFAHADAPADPAPVRGAERAAPYDVLFALQDAPLPLVEVADLAVERIELGPGTAQCPLTLSIVPEAGGLRITTDYDRELFDQETAERVAFHYGRLLETLVTHPDTPVGRVPLLSEDERDTTLLSWNETAAPAGDPAVIHEAFLRQADRTPDAPALRCGTARLSYAELAGRVRRRAGELVALGVGRGDVVGVHAERTPELVTALLSVMAAGAAYLPLDPAHPAERNRRALADAGARFLIVGRGPGTRLDAPGVRVLDAAASGGPRADLPAVNGRDVAYVMYTSGSTGSPKGVMVAHDGVCNDLEWRRRVTGIGPGDRLLHTVSFSFDPSVWQLFGPLAAGAEVVLAGQEDAADPASVVSLVREHRITVCDFVPSTLAGALDAASPGDLGSLTHVFCGGERLPRDLAARFHGRLQARLFNQYGPTEATIDTTSHPVTPADPGHETAIGRPIGNKRVYVLDDELQPLPVRVPGELWIGGTGLAYGYIGSPSATADRFRPDPYGPPGSRMYRSGDLARHRHDGTLEFLGRVDDQLKLNGVRIEPGEIESALRRHPDVTDAVVVLRDVRGRPALVGYVVSPREGSFETSSLRGHLVERVPPSFVPAHLVRVDEFPRGVTGKVAAARLPDPPAAAPVAGNGPAPGSVEWTLAELWAELLGTETVPGDADFFQLGGDSMLAVRLVAAVRDRFATELALHEFFTAPTLAELADLVRARGADSRRPAPAPVRRDAGRVPLSYAQERVHRLAEAGAGAEELHVSLVAGLRGPLDLDVLRQALETVVARHEALRVAVVPAAGPGRPAEQVVREPYPVRLGPDAAEPSLDSGELLTARVTRLGPDEHELALTLHRIAVDGASTAILVEELAAAYDALRAGRTPESAELGLQHPDYAAWERSWLTGDVVAEAVQDWLSGGWSPAPPPAYGARRLHRVLTLDGDTTRALGALARERRCSLRTVLLTAWATACARTLGRDPIVCVPVSGRDHPDFQRVIGRFVNLAVLRIELDGTEDLALRIERVRAAAVDAYRRQGSLPFSALELAVGGGRAPLFPMMFDLDDRATGLPRVGGLDIVVRPPREHRTDFGLALHAHHHSDTLELTMLHDPDAHGPEPMADLFDELRATLGREDSR
ncbi:amino acid adenylation domain-containing protein [Planomonospora sp. ID67723]|uniref:non-ribosomal peptide synthetase n=1 Tax=Planomonospora sp. ID67723 TaxID=2738134 RepID=UPI0018C3D55B|nr:non-ribosomal peptide synthetase [Planomonospora sp. ID67723]MBG0833230.1 amino acid adenylation domain-containing protein [Planomonospora sp. ID67723]